jgi:AcrR family transcriptional regulator
MSRPVPLKTEPARPRQRVMPVQARARRKLDAILDATAVLLARQGAEAATMLAIADEAGVSPATVYHYFENRLAVFAAVAERTMTAVDGALSAQLEAFAASAEQSSGPLLQVLYHAYHDAPGYVQVLTALRAEPALRALVQESNRRIAEVLADVLVRRTGLPPARATRVGWILSESCEQVLEAALMAPAAEAAALLGELTVMVDALFRHYIGEGRAD